MRYTLVLLGALPLLSITGCQSLPLVGSSFSANNEAKDMERFMDAYSAQGMFNGIALVARDGEVIFEKTYGFANEEWKARPDRHTKFRLASVTKQFTAMMILQLAEEGKLKLEDNISDHLPWYREDTGKRITIHQLLTHTSGIPNYSEFSGFFSGPSRLEHKMRDFVEKYCSNDLESEPGERYSYCNSGYYILGAILQEIEGKPWEDVIEERIAKRGSMPETGAYRQMRLLPGRAQGYWRDSDQKYQPVGHQDMTIWRAAGSMYSSANDMLRWDQALRENILVGEEWKNKMFSRQHSTYGYGVNVFEAENAAGEKVRYIGHSGFYAGFNNYFAHFPDTGEAVILLNNGGRTDINSIRDGIINIILDKPYDLPLPTFRLRTEGESPRLTVNKISSHGVIGSDDATFKPVDASAGSTIYAMNFLVHDGQNVYLANTTGGKSVIENGELRSDRSTMNNDGMTYSSTPWLKSDLAVSLTGTDSPKMEIAWTFHNTSREEKSIRMMWFTDADLTTADSTSSEDRLALRPEGALAFNHPKDDTEPDSKTGLLFRIDGAPHHFLGIAADSGASGYWRSSAPFETIGPKAAGYQIPEDLRGTIQNDEDKDNVTDSPRDIGISAQSNITIPARASQTVRYIVEFGPEVELSDVAKPVAAMPETE